MKIIVVGGGKIGETLVEQLAKEGHDLVLIDNQQAVIEETENRLDVMGIYGNGASHLVQIEAGVPKADLLIAVTNSDELNMLCCLVAKKLGARHTIARIRNPEYNDQLVFLREELGLSLAINPEAAAAGELFRMLRFPSALKIETFSRGRVELAEVRLREGSKLDGLYLHELSKKFQVKVLVCVVQRGEQVLIPTGDFRLCAGDKISIAAGPAEIERFFRAAGLLKEEAHSVMIVGGGRIAHYLCRKLLGIGVSVKIIDTDPQRCRHLCEQMPRAMIICGDGTKQELLFEEGLERVDAFVSLTGLDEQNAILSMFAASRGVGKVITKVSRTSLLSLVESAGLESVISPKEITANQIVRYVRAMQNSLGSNVETLYKLVGGRVEALEFRVKPDFPHIGTPLKDLTLKPNLLLACITRGDRAILPGGGDSIAADDRVVVVTTNQQLRDLSDILL
ncbi:Trk system potassium transporter TrkA [Yanshouia hominis]|uniref:Trk system potassium uptake protein TrkA n=1 Tax=Yanshouia hominis TaxID=2763673 RepID=A0ABR7NIY0_9FIRM|nr:Trk system potassium transporter TrkA [Yanshouia hominis]MBC8576369.1 Trk system potassium transporter TrkA [Yanshouia hominis]